MRNNWSEFFVSPRLFLCSDLVPNIANFEFGTINYLRPGSLIADNDCPFQ